MSRLVRVYKGSKKPDTYIYVDYADALSRVPQALLDQFGEAEQVLSLKLETGRRLARADAAEVLAQIAEVGFYLQMPPANPEFRAAASADAPKRDDG
jgi:hypothetical protein